MQAQSQIPELFDVIILGASGFTGKYVVREALKLFNLPSSPIKNLALAGRNPTKVKQALQWASPSHSLSIPILTADTTDPPSLHRLCSQTKLLLNCVGPYRLHGDPVAAACVHSGCDYLDISGEPEFMERMEARQWIPPAVPNQIEAYVSLESDKRIVGNFGTYESAVLGVANAQELQKLRQSRPRRARPVIPGPAPLRGPLVESQKRIGLWAIKLPSADATVVRRTLSILTENPHGLPGANESPEQREKREAFWSTVKPAHFGVKLGSKSLLDIFRFIILGISIGLLSGLSFGRWLLLKFPSIFSLGWFRKRGPSEDEVESASFKMWFIGHGFSDSSLVSQGNAKPDMEIITRVTGPEIGYIATPIILMQCALIVLSQREILPKGGVFPPGIVFGATELQQRLQENGISFDVISKSSLPA
ncbi:putative mitochondrial saccharopine dehydrogenase-like oxidoreductase [Citrus sinensis]|nr:putative mitochondrial saccharopine dehydrogenase-like oxidoreductase [Citrus sinensis]